MGKYEKLPNHLGVCYKLSENSKQNCIRKETSKPISQASKQKC